jgi:hypothetical protein
MGLWGVVGWWGVSGVCVRGMCVCACACVRVCVCGCMWCVCVYVCMCVVCVWCWWGVDTHDRAEGKVAGGCGVWLGGGVGCPCGVCVRGMCVRVCMCVGMYVCVCVYVRMCVYVCVV